MIDKIKSEYTKNPNRSYYLVWFGLPVLYLMMIIPIIYLSEISFLCGVLYLLITSVYLVLRLVNSYAILKIKNRSMLWMILTYGIFSLMLPCLKKHPLDQEPIKEESNKRKINYNINGNCTFNGRPCKMFEDLGICNCEMCRFNPKKEVE